MACRVVFADEEDVFMICGGDSLMNGVAIGDTLIIND